MKRGSSERRSPSVAAAFAVRLGDAYLAIAVFAFLELLVVGALHLREFAGAYELSLARNELTPIALAIAAPLALVAGWLLEVAARGRGKGARATLATMTALAGGGVAWGVASGRHFQGGGRAPFAIVFGLVAAGIAYAVAPALARALDAGVDRRKRVVLAAAIVALAVTIEIVNARVLPRLYPPFHVALAILAALVVAFVAAAIAPRPGEPLPRVRPILAVGVALASFAAVKSAATKLATHDNLRMIYLEHAPLLANVVEIGSKIAPPPPLDDTADVTAKESGHAIDWSGRDLLLVTVDALRADHVGAYGYERATTPHLDALAKEGAVFEHAYSPTPHTSYAVTSLMTGKYMRPLLLQGLGADSETWAGDLRRYGYRTAAFYPPAVFFIDAERFTPFRDRHLDFEYRRVEFLPAKERAAQVSAYLAKQGGDRRVFLWVHLFEPHEPYEAHPEHPFGDRDVDRYDSEIAAADDGIGAIVAAFRAARPSGVVIASADHGEEFDDHGGRYHGTTTYEEQVRVPLIVNAPGLVPARRIAAPVQLVDLLPTVLASLSIPRPARVRGNDLGPLLSNDPPKDDRGFAFSETDGQTMLARGSLRLLCARKVGACSLYDLANDPEERSDVSGAHESEVASMKAELRALEASHGKYELQGLRSEGKGWPEAIRRGLAGDGDAAMDVAALLDDADVGIRRKAAEVSFELGRPESAAPLRLALVRDEDETVRRWCALALTRLGEGAPRVRDLLSDPDLGFRRLAALALAESGDKSGEDTLIAWLRDDGAKIPFERAREVIAALGKIKSKYAFGPLVSALDDLRLRPYAARALASLGQEAARPALAEKLAGERSQTSRVALVESLIALAHVSATTGKHSSPELRDPLVRFLGTPDPLPNGLGYAMKADLLELVGGPRDKDIERIRKFATSGVVVGVIVAPSANASTGARAGTRVICRAKSTDGRAGELRFGPRVGLPSKRDRDSTVPGRAPEIDREASVVLPIASAGTVEPFATLPVRVKPGTFADFVVYATQNVALEACAVVPLAAEVPPPPPEPWTPSKEDEADAP